MRRAGRLAIRFACEDRVPTPDRSRRMRVSPRRRDGPLNPRAAVPAENAPNRRSRAIQSELSSGSTSEAKTLDEQRWVGGSYGPSHCWNWGCQIRTAGGRGEYTRSRAAAIEVMQVKSPMTVRSAGRQSRLCAGATTGTPAANDASAKRERGESPNLYGERPREARGESVDAGPAAPCAAPPTRARGRPARRSHPSAGARAPLPVARRDRRRDRGPAPRSAAAVSGASPCPSAVPRYR